MIADRSLLQVKCPDVYLICVWIIADVSGDGLLPPIAPGERS